MHLQRSLQVWLSTPHHEMEGRSLLNRKFKIVAGRPFFSYAGRQFSRFFLILRFAQIVAMDDIFENLSIHTESERPDDLFLRQRQINTRQVGGSGTNNSAQGQLWLPPAYSGAGNRDLVNRARSVSERLLSLFRALGEQSPLLMMLANETALLQALLVSIFDAVNASVSPNVSLDAVFGSMLQSYFDAAGDLLGKLEGLAGSLENIGTTRQRKCESIVKRCNRDALLRQLRDLKGNMTSLLAAKGL